MVTFTAGPVTPSGWLARRRAQQADALVARELAWSWRQVAEGAGIGRSTISAAGIGGTVAPVVDHVHLGPGPVRLTVRLLPGQLPEDVTAAGRRLAEGLAVAAVRVRPILHGLVEVTLVERDPLAAVVEAVAPAQTALSPLVLGIGEDGQPVTLGLADAAHIAIQGGTGSGKSVALYSLLGQLAEAEDVAVTGCDPTGLLLRPWAGRRRPRSIPAPAVGMADLEVHVAAVEALVAELDRRVAAIPAGRDAVVLALGLPVVVVVLEELPGLYRALDVADSRGLGRRARAAVARLLAEGRKAGIRVVLVTQRADAAIIGAYERAQCGHRLSYRVDSTDALRMLHPDAGPEDAAEHSTALPGVALATIPGHPLTRLRSPLVDYADYVDTVTRGGGGTALGAVA